MLIPSTIPIQSLEHPLLALKNIELAIMRLDLIHPGVSGNKFFKLKYNLEQARKEGKDALLTFGGAYSNHIFATAEAAKAEGFQSIGIIRGERTDPLNPTLAHAESLGMKLHFVDRETYRGKSEPNFINHLENLFGDFYLIPEGGTNESAIKGTREIIGEDEDQFSHLAVSIGTGGTFAGLAGSISSTQKLIGFSSLKGEFIHSEIEQLLSESRIFSEGSYQVNSEYHFGGYGKYNPELIEFIQEFYENFGIVLDPIYTGKMAFGVWDLIKRDGFEPQSKILLIHTGGLQGNLGFTERTGIILPGS
ncbi:MAG: pyridoxal-phosphate dependent enzyme [Algoriphagus sp.]|nr:pyridoxal-phosphate dependent enzyme [Algoriphagus sp.]